MSARKSPFGRRPPQFHEGPSPLYRRLSREPELELSLVHTGQHRSNEMSGQFCVNLAPEPHFKLEWDGDASDSDGQDS